MNVEFDPEKAAQNPINHDGVTFEEAKTVLLDPYLVTREDKDVWLLLDSKVIYESNNSSMEGSKDFPLFRIL